MKITLIGNQSLTHFSSDIPISFGKNSEFLDINYQAIFNPDKIDKNCNGLWRYRHFLPLDKDANPITFSEGNTAMIPIVFPEGFRAQIKLDFLFPTGSYKDRGTTVMMTKIKELGIQKIIQDSSGNAGASVAAYAAKAGIACEIYLPDNTEDGKITQVLSYGARVIKVKGNRKETAAAAILAAKESYYASHSFNPYFFQGTKTFAYEICEQLKWKVPDAVVLPAGNGTLLLGCSIGFNELANSGVIDKIPKLIAIQSENCQPLKLLSRDANFDTEKYVAGVTLAEGIAVANPVRINQMLKAVYDSAGEIITVNDNEIISSWKFLAAQGHYVEPTSAAAIAGIRKYARGLNETPLIVSLFSGSGLKSSDKIRKLLSY